MKRTLEEEDKVKGMCCGVLTGDALGAPFEFASKKRKLVYNGKLDKTTEINTQWAGLKQLSAGQVTDDSEMTISLALALIENRGVYNDAKATQQYMNWTQTTWTLGKNTRAIFKRFKTIKNCNQLIEENSKKPLNEMSQSNGALMRCSPFALLLDKSVEELEKIVGLDCGLSNPHPICKEVCFLHVKALQMAIKGKDKTTIFDHIKKIARHEEIRNLLSCITGKDERNVKEKKGWILHAFWVQFRSSLEELQLTY